MTKGITPSCKKHVFAFPKEVTRRLWLSAIHRDADSFNPDNSVVCELHFRARAHWPLCLATGGDIYSRRKLLFSSFGEHTAVCGSSVRQAVARPRHRQSVCIHNIHVAATCRPSVLGSATMRGHMWLNKVVSVIGPLKQKISKEITLRGRTSTARVRMRLKPKAVPSVFVKYLFKPFLGGKGLTDL